MIRALRLPVLAHFLANAVLFWLGYYWLGLGEGRASALAWSAFIALVVLCVGCWSYGAALVFFSLEGERRGLAAWRIALRNLAPLAVAALAVIVLYYWLARWADYSSTPASQLASFLTLRLRKPVKPVSVLRVFNALLWLVRWAILPALLLPMLSAIAAMGWRGFQALGARARKWLYWIETPLLLVCTIAIPLKLVSWVPEVGGFGFQTLSFVLRAGAAYLLFVVAWLVLAFVTSGGRPRLTQDKTAVSP